jgi:hypothetical protein
MPDEDCKHERVRLAEWIGRHETGSVECHDCGKWGTFVVDEWVGEDEG